MTKIINTEKELERYAEAYISLCSNKTYIKLLEKTRRFADNFLKRQLSRRRRR